MSYKAKKSNTDWQTKKLGEVCEIVNGGTPSTKIKDYWDGNILWITPRDMGKLLDVYTEDTLRKITRKGLDNSSARLVPENSIILSTRAPIGHLAINKKPMSFNQGCRGLVVSKEIETKYLYYFLSNSVELLNSLGTGTTFKELSTKSLQGVGIPLPPIQEQKQIVKALDILNQKTKSLQEIYKSKLERLEELKKSLLHQAFTGQL